MWGASLLRQTRCHQAINHSIRLPRLLYRSISASSTLCSQLLALKKDPTTSSNPSPITHIPAPIYASSPTIPTSSPEPHSTHPRRSIDAANLIRQAVARGDYPEAFRVHSEFTRTRLDDGGPHQSRLVTTSLIHSLLRNGRRFKAAQVAESAWLGTSASMSTLLDGSFTAFDAPMKLSYKTSNAIIQSLCPPLSPVSQPSWELFASPSDVGAGAKAQGAKRTNLTEAELALENQFFSSEGMFTTNPSAHLATIRQLLAKSEARSSMDFMPELLKEPQATLDKATQRALVFLRVARQARQRRTGAMFRALVDACLLQGEIIIGTLLFVLLVREWKARQVLRELLTEDAPNKASHRDMTLHQFTFLTRLRGKASHAFSTSESTPMSLARFREIAREELEVDEPTSHDHTIQQMLGMTFEDEGGTAITTSNGEATTLSILRDLLNVIGYPADRTSQSIEDRLDILPQPQFVDIRFPRPLLDTCRIAFELIARLGTDGWLSQRTLPLAEALLEIPARLGMSGVRPRGINHPYASSATPGQALREQTPLPLPTVIQECAKALIASFYLEEEPTSEVAVAMLRLAYFVLRSKDEAGTIRKVMRCHRIPLNTEEGLAVTIEGSLEIGDPAFVMWALQLATERHSQHPTWIDPRVVLLHHAIAIADGHTASTDVLRHGAVQRFLRNKLAAFENLPRRSPVLLNAVLKYIIATGRTQVVVRHLSELVVFPYNDIRLSRSGSLAMLASFGHEFFDLILEALIAHSDPRLMDTIERIWQVARRAEICSWDRELSAQADHSPKPHFGWSLVPSLEKMVRLYRGINDFDRARWWRGGHPLDSVSTTPSMAHGRTPGTSAGMRQTELHQFRMVYKTSSTVMQQEIWRAIQEKKPVSNSNSARSTSPLPSSTKIDKSSIRRLIPQPDATYWMLLLNRLKRNCQWVPIRQSLEEEVWPQFKEEGGRILKIIQCVGEDDSNPLLKEILKDMERLGWTAVRKVAEDALTEANKTSDFL